MREVTGTWPDVDRCTGQVRAHPLPVLRSRGIACEVQVGNPGGSYGAGAVETVFALVRLHQVKVAAGVFNHKGVRVGFISFALEGVVIKKAQVDPVAAGAQKEHEVSRKRGDDRGPSGERREAERRERPEQEWLKVFHNY